MDVLALQGVKAPLKTWEATPPNEPWACLKATRSLMCGSQVQQQLRILDGRRHFRVSPLTTKVSAFRWSPAPRFLSCRWKRTCGANRRPARTRSATGKRSRKTALWIPSPTADCLASPGERPCRWTAGIPSPAFPPKPDSCCSLLCSSSLFSPQPLPLTFS